MKKEMIKKIISLLDPIGVYGLGPLDEYDDIAEKTYQIIRDGKTDYLKEYLINQYSSRENADLNKVDLAVDLLVFIDQL